MGEKTLAEIRERHALIEATVLGTERASLNPAFLQAHEDRDWLLAYIAALDTVLKYVATALAMARVPVTDARLLKQIDHALDLYEAHRPRGAGERPVEVRPAPPAAGLTPEQFARQFHETYERLAPSFGYETRRESAKPWDEVPDQNRRLMTAVCAEVLARLGPAPGVEHDRGYWPKDDIRRAFVAGVAWWEFTKTGATIWASDRTAAEEEAERRYPGGATAEKMGPAPGEGAK
jgi:hypothetical protein